MADFPLAGDFNQLSVITTMDPRLFQVADFMSGMRFNASSVAAWPAASRAYAMIVTLQQTVTVTKMAWYNGATVSGNVDVGIYDTNYNKVVSSGSTAQAGASALQVVDIADTTLPPGDYFFAQVMDNVTGLVFHSANPSVSIMPCLYGWQMSTAFPLPATFVPVVTSSNMLPLAMALLNGTIL